MDDPVCAFAAEARRYCALIEQDDPMAEKVFARQYLSALLRLYQCALLLPAMESEPRSRRIGSPSRHAVMQRVVGKLAGRAELADALAEIWGDVKDGLMRLDSNSETAVADAVAHWRGEFEEHWGANAARAIGELHAMCFGRRW